MKLFDYGKTNKSKLILGVLFMSLGMVFFAFIYHEIYPLISQILSFISGEKLDLIIIRKSGRNILFLFLLSSILNFLASILSHDFAYQLIADLRVAMINKLRKIKSSYFDRNSTGNIKEVIDDKVGSLESIFAHDIPNFISTIFFLITIMGILFEKNKMLALTCLIPIGLGILAQINMFQAARKSDQLKELISSSSKIKSKTIEYVETMPAIKIFGRGLNTFSSYKEAMLDHRDLSVKMSNEVNGPNFSKYRTIIRTIPLFTLLGFLISKRNIDLDILVYFLIIAPGITEPIFKLSFFASWLNMAGLTIRKINDFMSEEEIEEIENKLVSIDNIKIENLNFSYDSGKEVLKNINLNFNKGSLIALVGKSGSGKTSLIKILGGLLEKERGKILINGEELVNTRALTDMISYISQETSLFSGSIRENLKFFNKDATDEDMIKASKLAGAYDFIMNLPKGYDTVFKKSNIELSGGEKESLTIARALIKGSELLLFDEVTSALDPLLEEKILNSLESLKEDKIIIFAAHRISSVKNADMIVVLKEGRVETVGTDENLRKKSLEYKRLVEDMEFTEKWSFGD
ncbi:MAG: ABC transporter ATP-binding protein/permease [Peptoniphilus sp.]|uniref:ABC transporter ATP-binding protein n=1 Tax=Peptoniphilus sp. TaxID=1971214 RepID=UPI0025DEC76E|nr:ABC transporter ATP-binding protein [Peptoniphilus sp.]MCI5643488.1 ABC transporter ATP-binding protein/permease [Peptoniphilus sp.]